MRVRIFSISILAAAAVMSMGLLIAPLQASQYLGEVIWDGNGTDGTFAMKAGISRVGGSYYEIQGLHDNTKIFRPPSVAIFSGGGVLVGDNLIFTVTQTPTDNQRCAVMQITINKNTCSGTFYKVKPMFFIHRNLLNSITYALPHLYPGSGPQDKPPFSNPSYLWSHITTPNDWPNPVDLGYPPTTGTLTATKTISLTPSSTPTSMLLFD